MTYIPNIQNIKDSSNSTTTPLNSSQVFSGTSTITNGYTCINLHIQSDQPSAANGLKIEFSIDGSGWYTGYTDTYYGESQIYNKTLHITDLYYKVEYTNGIDNQTSFNLTSYLTVNNTVNNSEILNLSSNLDAFGRVRMTEPLTILDFTNNTPYGTSSRLTTKTTGTGSIIKEDSIRKLSVLTNGDTAICQTKNYAYYQPGKSLLIMISCILNANNNANGTSAKVGFYDSSGGLYFQYENGVYSVVLKNADSETEYTQSNWNIDPFDGTGKTGITIDFTKSQIFVIDLEWLGVGQIRYGFVFYGKVHYCHNISNVNSLLAPYIFSANKPIRAEISSSISSNAGSVFLMCGSVSAEGGLTPFGHINTISNGSTAVTVVGTEKPILIITGNSNYYHQLILPTNISINDTQTANTSLYRLRKYDYPYSPDSSGSITWTDVDVNNSVIKYATTINNTFTTTGSRIINQDYFGTRNFISTRDLSININNDMYLGSNIDNNPDIMCLTCVRVVGNNACNILATLEWQEI